MAGRKAKPTRLKLLEGNPGKRRLPTNEPQPATPLQMPDFVSDDAVAAGEWHRLVATMPPGFFTGADVGVIALHCLAWSTFLASHSAIERDGLTVPGSRGQSVLHPAFAAAQRATATLFGCADRLGLHPAARARMNMPHSTDPAPDPLDDLLRG